MSEHIGPEMSEEDYDRIAYNAYCASTDALLGGEPFPRWESVTESQKTAWCRSAAAVRSAVSAQLASMVAADSAKA